MTAPAPPPLPSIDALLAVAVALGGARGAGLDGGRGGRAAADTGRRHRRGGPRRHPRRRRPPGAALCRLRGPAERRPMGATCPAGARRCHGPARARRGTRPLTGSSIQEPDGALWSRRDGRSRTRGPRRRLDPVAPCWPAATSPPRLARARPSTAETGPGDPTPATARPSSWATLPTSATTTSPPRGRRGWGSRHGSAGSAPASSPGSTSTSTWRPWGSRAWGIAGCTSPRRVAGRQLRRPPPRAARGPLGLRSLHLIEPAARPFADALTTAVVADFEVGARAPLVGFDRVATLDGLAGLESRRVPRTSPRRSPVDLPQPTPDPAPRRLRGARRAVPGAPGAGHRRRNLGGGSRRPWRSPPGCACLRDPRPRALRRRPRPHRRLGAARGRGPPRRFDQLDPPERAVERFLEWARAQGAHEGYVARHRRAWWSVGLQAPAPILATYMAWRPPAFVRNLVGARHINIAHGLHPRAPLRRRPRRARPLLTRTTRLGQGRTYAGGLTKFEPREMERLWVPRPEAPPDPDLLGDGQRWVLSRRLRAGRSRSAPPAGP